MRCPDCSKFVAYGDGSVDDVDVEIDEDSGEISITGRVVLPCAECGAELKELSVDETVEVADEFADVLAVLTDAAPVGLKKTVTPEWVDANVTVRYEFDGDPDTEFHERAQTTVKVPIKKKGKVVGHKDRQIKSARYMKTYKGVRVSGTVKRTIEVADPEFPKTSTDDTADFEHTIEAQSSAFDEIG